MEHDPRIRHGEGAHRTQHLEGGSASIGGKSLEVSPGIHKPKASTWDSIVDLISTPLHAFRRIMSSKPYSGLALNTLFPHGSRDKFTCEREDLGNILQALGKSLYQGISKDDVINYQKQSWGLDYHLRDEFLSRKDGLVYLTNFRSAIEDELHGENGLYQQRKEALVNCDKNPTAYESVLKTLNEQIAGAEALLNAHDNILAREIFWDVDNDAIFEKTPLRNFLDILPKGSKHHDAIKFYLSENPDAMASGKLLEELLGKCTRRNNWAFTGAELLKIIPDKAIAEILLQKPPREAVMLLQALPRERASGIEQAFTEIVLKDPKTGAFHDPLLIAERILVYSNIQTLTLEPEKTLLGSLTAGIEPGELVDASKLKEAREAFEAAEAKCRAAEAALSEAKAHNFALGRINADSAMLNMSKGRVEDERKQLPILREQMDEKLKALGKMHLPTTEASKLAKKKLQDEIIQLELQIAAFEASVAQYDEQVSALEQLKASAPAGKAYSREHMASLEAALATAQTELSEAKEALELIEAEQAEVGEYHNVVVPTLINLVLMLPVDQAEKLVNALHLNPSIKIDSDTLEDLTLLVNQRKETAELLTAEAKRLDEETKRIMDYHGIHMGDGTLLTDRNVAQEMGRFVAHNRVNISTPPNADKHLVNNIGRIAKGSPIRLLQMQEAVKKHIDHIDHMLFLCEEAIELEKDFGPSGSQSLRELREVYAQQKYGLQILNMSIGQNVSGILFKNGSLLEHIQHNEAAINELAQNLISNAKFKEAPETYILLIAGARGTDFAIALANEIIVHCEDSLASREHVLIGKAMKQALEALPEVVPYEKRERLGANLAKQFEAFNLNLGKGHPLNRESFPHEMRRIAEEGISAEVLKKRLYAQLSADNANLAHSKALSYAKVLEDFIVRLEVIQEDEKKANGVPSKRIGIALEGYREELQGVMRFAEALEACIKSDEELESGFIEIKDSVSEPMKIEAAVPKPRGKKLPLKINGKDLSAMNDDALVSYLSSVYSTEAASSRRVTGIDLGTRKRSVVIEALKTKQKEYQEELEILRENSETLPPYREEETVYRMRNIGMMVQANKLQQSISTLEIIISQLSNVQEMEEPNLPPLSISMNGTAFQVSGKSSNDLYLSVREKYHTMPQGTDPTLADLGITFEDDADHGALMDLQWRLNTAIYRESGELRAMWDNFSIDETTFSTVTKGYSGLTILHRAVVNEMRNLGIGTVGDEVDIWADPYAPIDPAAGG